MEDLLQTALDAVVDSVTTEVIETVVEETVATTEVSTEDLAWSAVDVMIDTGAGDALLALTGGPVALILAYKVFKQWRKKTRRKHG